MKSVKKAVHFAMAAVLTLAMMPVTTFAAADDSVWVAAVGNDSASEQNVTASVVTDTAVTDGVIALTYDSSLLTYDSVSVNEDYVEMYAVNADEAGIVKISWIAGDVPETDGTETAFIKVAFTGDQDGAETFTVSGNAYVYANGTAESEKVEEVKVEKSETVETETNETETTDKIDESETKESTAGGSNSNNRNHKGSSKDKTTNSKSVKTGDETPVTLYVVLLVAAAAVIAGILAVYKRRKAK